MKDKINFKQVGTLLRKSAQERSSAYKKGNFDAFGFLIRWALIIIFLAMFVIFFGRFTNIYLAVKTGGLLRPQTRMYELLSMVYTLILVFLVISSVSQIDRQFFDADDMKLIVAMPLGASTVFIAKLISIYFSQFVISAACVLVVNIVISLQVAQGAMFYGMTVVFCFVLPLISIAIGALVAMPFHAVKQFLKTRFVLYFIIITVLLAAGFYIYSVVLNAVRDMLLGDSLKFFFNEQVMNILQTLTKYLYPAVWFADILMGNNLLIAGLGLLGIVLVCLAVAMLVIHRLMLWVMQSRIAGDANFMRRQQTIAPKRNSFFALMKKDFLLIFRTQSYTFSYFSVAIIMPLMVYFCMTIGSSIVTKLIGMNCNLEIAIFLTLMFGALTNVFCSTNISRDGEMFFSVKAYPLGYKKVFFSKVVLCMMVTSLSQLVSAVLLASFGYVVWWQALFILLGGLLCSFAQICFATRYDFNHAKFSTEEDGEIKESGNTVSVIMVVGMLSSFLIGGSVLLIRLLFALRLVSGLEFLTYLIVGAVSLVIAVLSYLYLIRRLGVKYHEFSGGGGL